jgi:hypothetical protein
LAELPGNPPPPMERDASAETDSPAESKSWLDNWLTGLYCGKWKLTPSLLKHAPRSLLGLLGVGSVLSAITIILLSMALLNEMSGIFINRPFEVIILIVGLSVLVLSAILLYPLLLLHYRFKIYFEEEVQRLDAKYREGLQEFLRRKGKAQIPTNPDGVWSVYEKILEDMSQENPDYQDFTYLFTTYTEVEGQLWSKIQSKIAAGKGTLETCRKELLREIFNATALENLEDTGYNLPSYTLPVSYCMLAVTFGFIIVFLIPLLGVGQVQFGDTSISLVWAAGGFVGAYIYSFLPFFQRCTRKDLPPRAFLYYALKVFIGPIAVAVFGNVFFGAVPDSGLKFASSVALGSVPFWLLAEARRQLLSKWNERFGSKEGIGFKDVFAIQGITYEYAERLHEEGVMNIQNLAFADPDTLSKRTKLNQNMIFDWKDQAILILLTGNILTEPLKKQRGGP